MQSRLYGEAIGHADGCMHALQGDTQQERRETKRKEAREKTPRKYHLKKKRKKTKEQVMLRGPYSIPWVDAGVDRTRSPVWGRPTTANRPQQLSHASHVVRLSLRKAR